jgi:uncharacterized protein (DUF169 family)
MVDESAQAAEKLLASLPDSVLDRLAELIAAKLGRRGFEPRLPLHFLKLKQPLCRPRHRGSSLKWH